MVQHLILVNPRREIVANKNGKSLKEAYRAFHDLPLSSFGVDGFAKPLRAHLIASQTPWICYDFPRMYQVDLKIKTV
jgi:hypothetical protein